ncbi:MAG: hypothetical protein K2K60_04625 [Clostridia bacterium]|nr:hypothetical protein [Clostridia bacterium]
MEKTGYLGPEGSYSHIAAQTMRTDDKLLSYASFPLVFSALAAGEVDSIVIPIENTLNGGVLQNIDLLQSTQNILAVDEKRIKIDHRLATLNGSDIKNIKRVYSHKQALGQCAKYLAENLPNAKLIETPSTAASLNLLQTKEDACIVGAHTKVEGITLSDKNVADEDNNFTHFLRIVRGAAKEGMQSKRVYFSVTCNNRSGALLSLLQPIYAHGLNMTKIESRPIKDRPDEYVFFIEAEGNYSSPEMQGAISEIKKVANSFKILGCY